MVSILFVVTDTLLRFPFVVSTVKESPYHKNIPWPDNDLLSKMTMTKVQKTKMKSEPCPYCQGTGKDFTCPDCDGSGIVCWSVGEYEYEHECERCSGRGFVKISQTSEKCEKCNGTGSIPKLEILNIDGKIGVSNFNVNKLATLPDCQISTKHFNHEMFYFKFKGGDGMVMGYLVVSDG